jgi:hypothetical protein
MKAPAKASRLNNAFQVIQHMNVCMAVDEGSGQWGCSKAPFTKLSRTNNISQPVIIHRASHPVRLCNILRPLFQISA